MKDKLKGAFRGCPHHGDDYESCVHHSGTAPCGVEEERDALAAHVERMTEAACEEGAKPKMRAVIDETPETSLAQRDARMKAEAMESLASSSLVGELHQELVRRCAEEYRRQAKDSQ